MNYSNTSILVRNGEIDNSQLRNLPNGTMSWGQSGSQDPRNANGLVKVLCGNCNRAGITPSFIQLRVPTQDVIKTKIIKTAHSSSTNSLYNINQETGERIAVNTVADQAYSVADLSKTIVDKTEKRINNLKENESFDNLEITINSGLGTKQVENLSEALKVKYGSNLQINISDKMKKSNIATFGINYTETTTETTSVPAVEILQE